MRTKRPRKFNAPDGAPALYPYAELLIKAALAEDVHGKDLTTSATVGKRQKGTAEFMAKEDFILAGLFMAETVFKLLDPKAVLAASYNDGDAVRKGEAVARISGRLDAILTGERVALNFMQRLSGVATLTSEFTKRIRGTRARILDTRKTTPCMRLLEKYAVRMGGGCNHRFGLYDSVLVKDNHIAAAGGVKRALKLVNRKYGDSVPVEVEVRDLKEAREALAGGADIIMLDNMDIALIKKALKAIKNKALVEVSGGVSLDNVREIASTGVDFISVGALTHSARAVDISMKVVTDAPKRGRRG